MVEAEVVVKAVRKTEVVERATVVVKVLEKAVVSGRAEVETEPELSISHASGAICM